MDLFFFVCSQEHWLRSQDPEPGPGPRLSTLLMRGVRVSVDPPYLHVCCPGLGFVAFCGTTLTGWVTSHKSHNHSHIGRGHGVSEQHVSERLTTDSVQHTAMYSLYCTLHTPRCTLHARLWQQAHVI